MPTPSTEGSSYTLRPMEHIWYKEVEVGGEEWNAFFTDMFYELPEGDIQSGNSAEIMWGEVGAMVDCMRRTVAGDCISCTFPMITERIQHEFAKSEKSKSECDIPIICGCFGAACRQMHKIEGSNRALCTYCSLAKFADEFSAAIWK